MHRQIILTKDGSPTIEVPDMHVTYHSVHGAVQESMHVFIQTGLHFAKPSKEKIFRILEMGFGTGLNSLLSWKEAQENNWHIHYTALELFPLNKQEALSLNYATDPQTGEAFTQMHGADWDQEVMIGPLFTLLKHHTSLQDYPGAEPFHLVYFDAFAPSAQPELWTVGIFEKLYRLLHPGGILVTYCSKGDVRRAMKSAGFLVEKVPGPPGKREIVRAIK